MKKKATAIHKISSINFETLNSSKSHVKLGDRHQFIRAFMLTSFPALLDSPIHPEVCIKWQKVNIGEKMEHTYPEPW